MSSAVNTSASFGSQSRTNHGTAVTRDCWSQISTNLPAQTVPLRHVLFRRVRKKVDLFLSSFLTSLFSTGPTLTNFSSYRIAVHTKFDTNPFIYIVQKEHLEHQTIKNKQPHVFTEQVNIFLFGLEHSKYHSLSKQSMYMYINTSPFSSKLWKNNKPFVFVFQIIIMNV